MDNNELIRLQVVLARSGIASRRKSEELIRDGRVEVNGKVCRTLGTKVDPLHDRIKVDGEKIVQETKKIYIALNKPKEYLSSNSDQYDRPLAIDLVQPDFSERLYNVGRLDYHSQGLLFFTNDGYFTKKISHPSTGLEKEYVVETTLPIPEWVMEKFKKGITVEGKRYTLHSYKYLKENKIALILIEGKNREIRRIFDHFKMRIKNLTRVRIGDVHLGDLRSGMYRMLTPSEIQGLLKEKENDRSH